MLSDEADWLTLIHISIDHNQNVPNDNLDYTLDTSTMHYAH